MVLTANKSKFKTGPVVATQGAVMAFGRCPEERASGYLERHMTGDWGDLCDEDVQANEEAIESGARIMSSYKLSDGTKLWIITDAEIDDDHNRQATTFLLPEEY